MELDLTVFDEVISRMSILQLADWLVSCRNQVKRENFDTDSEYYEKLKIFCDEWEKHYNKYEDFYTDTKYGKKFYKALVYTTVKDNITLVTKTYSEEVRCPIRSCEELSNITIDRVGTISAIEEQTGLFYEKLENIFIDELYDDYKTELHEKNILLYRFSSIEFERGFNEAYKGKSGLLLASRKIYPRTYKELEEICEKTPHIVSVSVAYKRNNHKKGLREYAVVDSVYKYFRDIYTGEKNFDKKLFINLGFCLGLPLPFLERLLEYNGYSISEKSQRKFDQIIRRAFKCGFSREMTIGLIDIERSKGYNIPNLTSNSKEK